jgi:hypothetical protein
MVRAVAVRNVKEILILPNKVGLKAVLRYKIDAAGVARRPGDT